MFGRKSTEKQVHELIDAALAWPVDSVGRTNLLLEAQVLLAMDTRRYTRDTRVDTFTSNMRGN